MDEAVSLRRRRGAGDSDGPAAQRKRPPEPAGANSADAGVAAADADATPEEGDSAAGPRTRVHAPLECFGPIPPPSLKLAAARFAAGACAGGRRTCVLYPLPRGG